MKNTEGMPHGKGLAISEVFPKHIFVALPTVNIGLYRCYHLTLIYS